MRNLYLLTNSFPYGKGEKSFILPEIAELSKEFVITIVSCATREQIQDKENITQLDSSITVILLNDYLSIFEKIIYFIKSLFSPLLWRELFLLKKNNRQMRKNWYYVLSFYARGCHIKKQLESMGAFQDDTIFYTYWYNHCTLGLLMAKSKHKNIKVITRTHGYDLYHERCPGNWQPFKKYMTRRINAIYFACKQARDYYIKNYVNVPEEEERLFLVRLGVSPKKLRNFAGDGEIFELVSCSNVIPLKRLELIIEALALCDVDMKIHWTHFGDGDSMQSVKALVNEKLADCKQLTITFCGHISNLELMKYYETHPVYCFITTSSTEGGCPVSIQEALSYGIPVIGTAVGGIPELIKGNGVLLSANPKPREVADAIKEIYYASEQEMQELRDNSYRLWQDKFDSDKNYKEFLRQLMEL